ncbi:S-locus-specific glycoprotein S6-like [Camellia sinensis]|uniref:S-locus-specific glycoprotein S6-like n=1 Tax=Camellia sinensis TaxID=4442 RepID=UPI0010363C8C|nr:S-locus-specific glycoprotein S6-like [Camellia sinensis]
MNNTVWLTNASVHSNNSIAVLSEKGDPTLKDSVSGLTLLESFNYPCETFLALHDARTEHKNRRETLPIFLEDRRRPIAWKGSVYLTLGAYNNSSVSIVVLASAGTVNIMRWDEQVKRWHVGWTVPVHPCDTYGVCGPSGLCNRDQSPNCECFKGFVPNSTED